MIWHYDEREGFYVPCHFFAVYVLNDQPAGFEVFEQRFASMGAGCYVVDVILVRESATSE